MYFFQGTGDDKMWLKRDIFCVKDSIREEVYFIFDKLQAVRSDLWIMCWIEWALNLKPIFFVWKLIFVICLTDELRSPKVKHYTCWL